MQCFQCSATFDEPTLVSLFTSQYSACPACGNELGVVTEERKAEWRDLWQLLGAALDRAKPSPFAMTDRMSEIYAAVIAKYNRQLVEGMTTVSTPIPTMLWPTGDDSPSPSP